MKILCSLGTHTQDFSRLARAIDEVAGLSTDNEIIVQTGVTKYDFKYIKNYFDFCPKNKMEQLVDWADVLVLQGGWGSIEDAIDKGKHCVVVPRIEGLEHVHNQEQLVRKLDSLGCVIGCFDVSALYECIEKAKNMKVSSLEKGDASRIINTSLKDWFK